MKSVSQQMADESQVRFKEKTEQDRLNAEAAFKEKQQRREQESRQATEQQRQEVVKEVPVKWVTICRMGGNVLMMGQDESNQLPIRYSIRSNGSVCGTYEIGTSHPVVVLERAFLAYKALMAKGILTPA